jgi:ABC-type multidrug transport system fused ATPase/permease subunit
MRLNNSILRLLQYAANYKRSIALNILCNLLMAMFMVFSIPALIPFLNILFNRSEMVVEKPTTFNLSTEANYLFSQWIQHYGKDKVLIITCLIIIVVFFFKNLFRYLALYFITPVRNGVVRDLRQKLFEKMLALPLSYFSEQRKGDLMSRITADAQEVEWSILNVIETLVREPVVMFGSLGFMIYVSPSLTLFVFGLIVFIALIIGTISKTLRKNSSLAQERLGNVIAVVEEALGGLRIIKGFNAEEYQKNRFAVENNEYRNLVTRILRRKDLASPMSEFLGVSVVAILLWYGSRQVFSGLMSPEKFLAFIYAFYNVIDPAKNFSSAIYTVQKGMAAADRIESVLATESSIQEKSNAESLPFFNKKIHYKNITFAYNDEKKVLKNVNVEIPKGKIVALVGASGSGKSTMADLLPRFYDVEEGEVLLDGINVKDLKIRDLRDKIGIVSQEAVLFNDSIFNNIVFGLENATRESVEAAAKIANAHEFIIATENGYDSNIGDRGMKLSGGQRQRLTIARAILKNPPILILDEATSALDSESEKLVQDALNHLLKNRTALVIAHRLSTIQHADEIIVMKEGEVIERGSHEVLLAKNGEYAKLVTLQQL